MGQKYTLFVMLAASICMSPTSRADVLNSSDRIGSEIVGNCTIDQIPNLPGAVEYTLQRLSTRLDLLISLKIGQLDPDSTSMIESAVSPILASLEPREKERALKTIQDCIDSQLGSLCKSDCRNHDDLRIANQSANCPPTYFPTFGPEPGCALAGFGEHDCPPVVGENGQTRGLVCGIGPGWTHGRAIGCFVPKGWVKTSDSYELVASNFADRISQDAYLAYAHGRAPVCGDSGNHGANGPVVWFVTIEPDDPDKED